MVWTSSRFRAGEMVEVRSKGEILATLDKNACVDGLPLMPEMLQFCGRRFRVRAVAHKTCDTIHKSGSRRLSSSVHLDDLRCDGCAHGGCEAECTLFWKDVWLKSIDDVKRVSTKQVADGSGCTEAEVWAAAQAYSGQTVDEMCYSCQATKLYDATEALASWNPIQYLSDIRFGNHSTKEIIRLTWLALLRWLLLRMPLGYRIMKRFSDLMHQTLVGRNTPSLCGRIPPGAPTPTKRLDLVAGECVRIKSQLDIEKTLDKNGKNRGLGFDGEEMALYCGEVRQVRRRVSRIIDETTGKMLVMKQPCIVLEGATCTGDYASRKLLCPRAIHTYWREIWLERINDRQSGTANAGTPISR